MRSFKIESYVPEKSFFRGKDARFCKTAYEDCFVVDIKDDARVLASCRENDYTGASLVKCMDLSLADAASLLHIFGSKDSVLILPCSVGTLLIIPAWRTLGLALVFLFKENAQDVQKAYQNAQRYAFLAVFEAEEDEKTNQRLRLENKLCTLLFYKEHLFGTKRQANATAHILMIANLVGCRLHETTILREGLTLDENELDSLGAYLFCTFMTMRRYNGKVSAAKDSKECENPENLTHVPQEYGLRIQQTVCARVPQMTQLDLPTKADIACFSAHPVFQNYKTEETNDGICLHIPIKQKALFSSITARGEKKEITITVFPLFNRLFI
jgi:hypothetical protein